MNKIKEQVIRAGLELCHSGLIARTWGNVSARIDETHFAITASGKSYESLREKDIVVLDLKNLRYEGDVKPSGEKKVHQVIYKMKPDAGFVIHTHQTYASVLSAMGGKLLDEKILFANYGLPGSQEVADNVAAVIEKSDAKAILLSNHGALCYGKDYDEAFAVVRELEATCKEIVEREITSKWQGRYLRVYLDDFAQMFGVFLDMKGYDSRAVAKKYGEDLEAVEMVVEKNLMAAAAAKLGGTKPISIRECLKMRRIYTRNYSKLKDES